MVMAGWRRDAAFVECLRNSIQGRDAGRLYRLKHRGKLCSPLFRARPAGFAGGKASRSGEMVSSSEWFRSHGLRRSEYPSLVEFRGFPTSASGSARQFKKRLSPESENAHLNRLVTANPVP
jgi:hypothetical protein